MNFCLNSCIYCLGSPESILRQDLTGVRVGEQRHSVLLDEQAELLRHHAAALEVNLAMDHVDAAWSTHGTRAARQF